MITALILSCSNSEDNKNNISIMKGWPQKNEMPEESNLILSLQQQANSQCSEIYKNKYTSNRDIEKLKSAYMNDPHRDKNDRVSTHSLCPRQKLAGITVCYQDSKITGADCSQSGDTVTYFYDTSNLDQEYLYRLLFKSSQYFRVIYYKIKK